MQTLVCMFSWRKHIRIYQATQNFIQSKSYLIRAIEIIEELKTNLKQASTSMNKLGEIYSELATSYGEVEKCERSELAGIAPQLGELYTNLKNCSYQLSHTYEQHVNIYVKYLGRNLQDVSELSKNLSQVNSSS